MKPIIFLHHPKAGGTSFIDILRQVYGERLVVRGPEVYRQRADAGLQPSAVFGHMNFGVHEQMGLKFDEVEYVTMLREPIARLTSIYYFAVQQEAEQKRRHNPELKKLIAAGMGLDGFLAWASRTWLGGEEPKANEQTRRMGGPLAAESNLRRCAVVGVTDLYDAFVSRCAHRFDWPTRLDIKQMNRATPENAEPLPPWVLRAAREANAYDSYLWTRASLFGDRKPDGDMR